MQDIQENHQCLQGQLQQFEMMQEQMGEVIIEVQRRIGILDEAMCWISIEVEPYQALPLEDAFQTVDAEDTEIQLEVEPQEFPPEEHSQEAIFHEELPEEEMFQEESSEEKPLEEGVFQEDEFRHLDTEDTEIKWVNR